MNESADFKKGSGADVNGSADFNGGYGADINGSADSHVCQVQTYTG